MKKSLRTFFLPVFCLLLPALAAGSAAPCVTAAETGSATINAGTGAAASAAAAAGSTASATAAETGAAASASETPQSEAPGKPAVTYKNKLVKKDGAIYYYNARGNITRSKWKTISGKRYYFTKTGAAAVGSVVINKKRYLFSAKGVLQKNGFKTVKGNTYYVNSKGIVAVGWQTIQNKLYRFTATGILRTGWLTKNGKTYYLTKKSGAYKGWHKIGKKSYYFDEKGVLAKNMWIDNKYVDKNGAYDPQKKRALAALETSLKNSIRSYRGTWSVFVQNLDTGESFSINNQPMYPASFIKLYALGAAYDRIAQNRLSESAVFGTLSDMITVSDNWSFNQTVRWVGTSYINTWCKQNGYTQTNQGTGLEPSGNSAGLANGSGRNMSSVQDCGKFLASVYKGTCVSKSASQKMLNLLKQQERRWKIPAGIPSGVTVANKTGETDDYAHDAAIVYSKGATYILVVMGYIPGAAWSSDGNIVSISRTVYNFFNK